MFFSHRPEREWQNKEFVRRDYAKHRRVAEAFYRHARAAVEASSFPVLEVNGKQQRGDDFGTRLANAFADAFAAGYEHVIAVGSDCPQLSEVDWSDVAGSLDRGHPVLGPTSDQTGTYLIGMSRSQFVPGAFARLPWKSTELLSALARHLSTHAGTAPVFLTARRDVNGHRDLLTLLQNQPSRVAPLIRQLRGIIGPGHRTVRVHTRRAEGTVLRRRSRAPPVRSARNCA